MEHDIQVILIIIHFGDVRLAQGVVNRQGMETEAGQQGLAFGMVFAAQVQPEQPHPATHNLRDLLRGTLTTGEPSPA